MNNGINTNYVNFIIPAYSEILNFIIDNDNLIIIYSEIQDSFTTDTKTIDLAIIKGTTFNGVPIPPYYKYKTSLKKNVPRLDAIASNGGPNININFNIIDNCEYYHIFVNEIISIAEKRDKILSEIV